MKRLVRSLLILGFALSAGAEDFTRTLATLSCPKDLKAWSTQLKGMRSGAQVFAKGLSSNAAEAKADLKERDIIFVTLLWPNFLESQLSYSAMYQDCADLHWKLLEKPGKVALFEWKNCVEHGYGREPLPEIYTFLRGCYDKLLP